MPPKIWAKLGVAMAVAALLFFWGTIRWLDTRTFKPVDMPISLDAGQFQTGNFQINLREEFQVYIHLDFSVDDYWTDGRCNSDSLPAMSWKVFRFPLRDQRSGELWASSQSRRDREEYLGQFDAVPGTYRFELQIPRATTCLNARHPHLRISTPAQDYAKFCNWLLYLWLSVAGLGAVLELSTILGWRRERLSNLSVTRIFPELTLKNVIPLKRHRPMLAIYDLRIFGPTWFGVIAALSVVFLLYLTKPLMQYGLPIDFPKHFASTAGKSPWPETLAVYVDAHREFLVNGKAIKTEKLREKLVEELGRRVVWTVYVEADRDSLWQDTVFVMDTIRGLGADVCWITPKTREEWSEQRPLRTPEGTIPIGSRQTYGAPTEKLQVRAR